MAKAASKPAKTRTERRRITVSRVFPHNRVAFRPDREYRVKLAIRDALKDAGVLVSDKAE